MVVLRQAFFAWRCLSPRLCRAQLWRRTWRLARCQAVNAAFVVAKHPVPQGLADHAGLPRSIKPRGLLQDLAAGSSPHHRSSLPRHEAPPVGNPGE